MKATWSGTLIVVTCWSGAVVAQELTGEAVVAPMTSAGATVGCSIQYTAVARDHVNSAGAPVGISGSLAWMLRRKVGIIASMKVIAADINEQASNGIRPFAVAHAFVRVNDIVFQAEQRYDCDQPTGFCGVVGMSNGMAVLEAIASGNEKVAFGFSRTKDSLDLSISVPALSLAQNTQLNECLVQLLDQAHRSTKNGATTKRPPAKEPD